MRAQLHRPAARARAGILSVAVLVLAAGCDLLPGPPAAEDAVVVAAADDTLLERTRALGRELQMHERLAEEKDTLIQTLHTAMVLFNELTMLERQVVAGEMRRDENVLQPWDQRVRNQLERLRVRYDELADEIERAEQRLRAMSGRDAALRASLADALRTAAELRADNEQKQLMIDQLVTRVAVLEREKREAVAVSEARRDTIRGLEEEQSRAYWIAGTEDELKRLGVVDVVGGRRIVFARVGETLAPGRGVDIGHFQEIDRRRTQVIPLPDDASYEVVSHQDLRYADPATLREEGRRQLVRHELRIMDPLFWENSAFLILVRR